MTASPETLTFTVGDWSTAQTVTVRAAAAADAADDTATVNHAVSGGDYGANNDAADPVSVTVDDGGGNHPATGRPDILGNAFVGDTLTAVTDNIGDADGLGDFEYLWWADGKLIAGATKATYELADAERDKKIKVSVSFTDGQGNAEGPLFSVSVGPVAGLPDAPSGLRAEAGDREVALNWTAPGNRSHVNPYNGGSKVMRHEISVDGGSWTVIPRSGEGEENEESYVVTQLQNGRQYGFQVRAVNAVGPSEASREVRMTPGLGICNRTPQVRDLIMYRLSHVDGCGSVTPDDLGSITNALYLGRLNITALRRGDFDGLTSVPMLELSGNQLSSLPAGIFDDLESLTTLTLGQNRLSSLRQDVFNNLAALTMLELRENRLSSLPPGVFDQLLALEYLDLYDNNLASFAFDAINALPALSFLTLAGNPIWVAGVVVKPTALTISRGDTATYRMRLNTFPLAGTRIEPAADSAGVTVSPASVTFARSDWFRYKDVTVSVAQSATAWSATVTHTVVQYGEFGMATPSVTITIPASDRSRNTVMIAADDTATTGVLSVADAEANEKKDSTMEFVVTLDPAASDTVTVDYATSDGTATAGEDYTATSGTLTFTAGETTKTISVPITDDAEDDGGETLTLTLSNASGADLGDAEAAGTIRNTNEAATPLTASFSNMPASHTGAEFTFGLTFSENVELSYVTLCDTAFAVTGGEVKTARRQQQGSNQAWDITVEPASANDTVTITLPETTDCNAVDAICTHDGRPLSHSLSATVVDSASSSAGDAANGDVIVDDGLDAALALVDGVTPDEAAAALSGEGGLSEAQLDALDHLGNRNGRYDLGDMLSWRDRCQRGEARCGTTPTDSGPASAAALLGVAAAGDYALAAHRT